MTEKASVCASQTAAGIPCKAKPLPGKEHCRWHSADPADREKHRNESRRGGLSKAYGALQAGSPLSDDPAVAELNLETGEGIKSLVAHTLHALARLPLDTRTANAIGQLVTAQRAVLETSDFEARLKALEEAQRNQRQRNNLRSA